jgi:hypothetical protein
MRLRKLLCVGLLIGSATTATVGITGGPAQAAITACDQAISNYQYDTAQADLFAAQGYQNLADTWYSLAGEAMLYYLSYC